MIAPDQPDPAQPSPGGGAIRQVLRRDGWSMLAVVAATLVVELGVYLAARLGDANPRQAILTALATMAVWTAVACPVFAAGGKGAISALLRGGIVADASGVALLVLWAGGRFLPGEGAYLSFLAAVEIYCTVAAMALVGVAGARCGRTTTGRYVAAVVTAVAMTAMLATPFWIRGPALAVEGTAQRVIVSGGVFFNPFYSMISAVADRVGFVWHYDAGAVYNLFELGNLRLPPVPWYSAVAMYLPLAGLLSATHLIRRRK